jgi:hypothetical protein
MQPQPACVWPHSSQTVQKARRRSSTRDDLLLISSAQALLEQHGAGRLVRLWGTTLLHRDDWPFDAAAADLPDSFTKFRYGHGKDASMVAGAEPT